MRAIVSRFLTHGVLVAALAIIPTLRVVCDISCVPGSGPTTETTVPSDEAPVCHGSHEGHDDAPRPASAPLPDGCTHGGESVSSSVSVSLNGVGGDGPIASSAPTVAVVSFVVGSPVIYPGVRSVPSTGQLLGLFYTPLRI